MSSFDTKQSLKILDIRVGRANRLQFLFIYVIWVIVSLSANASESAALHVILILMSYFGWLAVVRRISDIGYSGLYVFWGVPIIFVSSFFGTLAMIASAAALCFFIFLVPGTVGANKFGPAPVGMDLNTMVRDNKE